MRSSDSRGRFRAGWAPVTALAVAALAVPAGAGEIKLVVVLVIDQFRGDYLTRFEPHFGSGGFKRLMRDGALFTQAYYPHASTGTGPGHATVITGRTPREHGIVANEWFLYEGDDKPLEMTTDRAYRIVGGDDAAAVGESPLRLIGPALGDQMKLVDRRSRVFAVSLKSRAAVMLGGKRPDGVYWWNDASGRCESSSYYTKALPSALAEFNASRWSDRFFSRTWEPSLPPEAYAGCYPGADQQTDYTYGLGPAFPHVVVGEDGKPDAAYYKALSASPYGNEVVLELARRVLDAERLGQGPAPDLLCISLSSNDLCGHVFGPDSAEVLDMTVQTDRQVAGFLELLDRQVGLERCALALSADHGVQTVPSLARALGLDAGTVDLKQLRQDLNGALAKKFGPLEGDYVRAINLPWLYLNPATAGLEASKRLDLIHATIGHCLRQPGIEQVFRCDEFMNGGPPSGTAARLAWQAYYPGRAGELFIQFKPFWYKSGRDATGHTTAQNHDRHVPVLVAGPGVRPGRYAQPASPTDIAPTLAAMLGIEAPLGATGRVLHEAMATAGSGGPPREVRLPDRAR